MCCQYHISLNNNMTMIGNDMVKFELKSIHCACTVCGTDLILTLLSIFLLHWLLNLHRQTYISERIMSIERMALDLPSITMFTLAYVCGIFCYVHSYFGGDVISLETFHRCRKVVPQNVQILVQCFFTTPGQSWGRRVGKTL